MEKFNAAFMGELHQPSVQWNPFIFGQLLKDAIKSNMFPNVGTQGELEEYINNYIKDAKKKTKNNKEQEETKEKKISRNTFHRWRQEGDSGPRSAYTAACLDNVFSNVYFMHRPCTKANKTKLFEVYSLAWCCHYEFPLLTQGEDFLESLLKTIQEEFEGKYAVEILAGIHGNEYDTMMEGYPENRYLYELLKAFWKGYHKILVDADLENKLYGVMQNGILKKYKRVDETLILLEEHDFQEKYKNVLLQRQYYLEGFADNLRTLFLGEDL